MGLCRGAAFTLNLWSERLEKNASGEPNTREGIEAASLRAFTPTGSPLDRHTVERGVSREASGHRSVEPR
jgi:hypothetical protein